MALNYMYILLSANVNATTERKSFQIFLPVRSAKQLCLLENFCQVVRFMQLACAMLLITQVCAKFYVLSLQNFPVNNFADFLDVELRFRRSSGNYLTTPIRMTIYYQIEFIYLKVKKKRMLFYIGHFSVELKLYFLKNLQKYI